MRLPRKMRIKVKSHLSKKFYDVSLLDEELAVKHDHDPYEFNVLQGQDGKLYLPLADQAKIGRAGRPGLYLVGSWQKPSFINMKSRKSVTEGQLKKPGNSKYYHCLWSRKTGVNAKPEIFDAPIYIGEIYEIEGD